MPNITFTIPSVLNKGGGEKKLAITASSLLESFGQVSEIMGDDFKRRVLNDDGSPRSLINIYINGKNARFSGGMNTSLKDGDEIYILPAVAGGSELSSKDIDRYSRQIMLEEIGYQGQQRLRAAKVCVVGVGGLGNPITTRLVAMGIGKIRIIDRDVIELSNLHRQTMFDETDVGQVKVEVAAKKLKKLNPDVEIESLPISINDYTALDAVDGCDVVIDALEDVKAIDIRVFDTSKMTDLFDRVIITTGNSNRQTRALAFSVSTSVKEKGGEVISIEGLDTGEWVLVDCGDVVVHILQPAIRAYYQLEGMWGGKPVRVKLASQKGPTSGPMHFSDDVDDE